VKFGTVVVCSKCKQPIVSGQGYAYICLKIPRNEGYHFFHRRFRTGDLTFLYPAPRALRLVQFTLRDSFAEAS
jgi:hypothetical protein